MGPRALVVVAAVLATAVAVVVLEAARRLRVKRLRAPGRAMGLIEHAFDAMHHLGAFVIVIVARIEGDVDEGVLRRALDFVQASHPLLQVHVEGGDGLFRSEGTGAIPLRIVSRDGDDHWKRVLLDEAGRPIPYGMHPLVKVTWIHQPGVAAELVLTANHSVVDGASAVVLLRDILTACGAGARVSKSPSATSALLPMDVRLKPRVYPPKAKEPRPALVLPETPTKVEERRPGAHLQRFSAATMPALLQRCRDEGTTFHGLLSAAALFALASEFGAERELSLSSNISVRNDLEPPVSSDSVGCFISGVTTSHRTSADAELWGTARSVREQIVKLMSEGRHLRGLAGRFTWLHELGLRRLLVRMNDGRINAVNISNSGKFDIPRAYGALKLSEIWFLSSQHVLGSTLMLAVVSLADELFITFSWARPVMTDDQAQRIVATFLRVLELAEAKEPVTIARLAPRTPPSRTRKSV